MLDRAVFYRLLMAAIIVVFLFLAIPLFFQVISFPVGGALWALIRLCIAALAVLYVFGGPPLFR